MLKTIIMKRNSPIIIMFFWFWHFILMVYSWRVVHVFSVQNSFVKFVKPVKISLKYLIETVSCSTSAHKKAHFTVSLKKLFSGFSNAMAHQLISYQNRTFLHTQTIIDSSKSQLMQNNNHCIQLFRIFEAKN